jgi:RNA polymerase sigma factor (sigma-70 family)
MSSASSRTAFGSGAKGSFQNTLWSRILAAGNSDSARALQAFEELATVYWRPVYAFVRRAGHDRHRASDLTQAFFAYIIHRNLLKKADPKRGRFRSFLLGTLKDFLSHEKEKENALRRGGDREFVSIDEANAEGLYLNEPSSDLTPDKLFDRQWAMAVLGEALRRLRADYARAGMTDLFTALEPYLTGDAESRYAALAERLDRSEGTVRVLIFRLRDRFRQLIRAVIADTVSDLEQLEMELAHFRDVLRGG